MTSDVYEVGGSLPWRRRVVMIRQAKRDIPPRQHFEDTRGIPTRIAKLEAVPAVARQHLEKLTEPICVRPEVRWKLKKDRADFVSKQGKAVFEKFETVGRAFRQSFPVGDES
jgi:hypothetical protein